MYQLHISAIILYKPDDGQYNGQNMQLIHLYHFLLI